MGRWDKKAMENQDFICCWAAHGPLVMCTNTNRKCCMPRHTSTCINTPFHHHNECDESKTR